MAKDKTISQPILQFSTKMLTEHENAQKQLEKILKENNISKISSADARTIREEVCKTMRMMKKLQGIAFDSAYMDYQISSHKQALEIINDYILHRVQNPALKNYTLQMKQNIENHLQEAGNIRGTI